MATSSDPSQLTGLAGLVVDTIELLGPVGVGLLVALETVAPPIPSEVVLPVAGFISAQGRMSVGLTMLCATIGSLVGAALLYWLGLRVGEQRLRRLIDRVPLAEQRDLDRSSAWFRRHGKTAVLTGRLVPIVRSLVSIPAGVERMPVVPFIVMTAIGSGLYNVALVGAGYLLGDRWTTVGEYSDLINAVLIGAIVLALGGFVVKRLHSRRRDARATGS